MKTSSIAVETSWSTAQSDSIVRQTNKRSSFLDSGILTPLACHVKTCSIRAILTLTDYILSTAYQVYTPSSQENTVSDLH